MSFVIFDNRRPPDYSLELEAGTATYEINTISAINYLLQCSDSRILYPPISSIIISNTTTTSRMVSINQFHAENVQTKPREGKCYISKIPSQTLEGFLCDALNKIQNSTAFSSIEKNSTVHVIAFLNDFNTFGINSEESLREFEKGIEEVKKCIAGSRISSKRIVLRIVCPSVIKMTSDFAVAREQKVARFSDYLQDLDVILRIIENSSIFYEDAVRSWLYDKMTPTLSFITFPELKGRKATILLALYVSTFSSVRAMHEGLKELELSGTVPRSAVDPLFVEGGGYTVRPRLDLQSDGRRRENALLFIGLIQSLVARDELLLVRVHYSNNYSHSTCYPITRSYSQYWALVPPDEQSFNDDPWTSCLTMIRLTEREAFIGKPLQREAFMSALCVMPEDLREAQENAAFIHSALHRLVCCKKYSPLAHPSGMFHATAPYEVSTKSEDLVHCPVGGKTVTEFRSQNAAKRGSGQSPPSASTTREKNVADVLLEGKRQGRPEGHAFNTHSRAGPPSVSSQFPKNSPPSKKQSRTVERLAPKLSVNYKREGISTRVPSDQTSGPYNHQQNDHLRSDSYNHRCIQASGNVVPNQRGYTGVDEIVRSQKNSLVSYAAGGGLSGGPFCTNFNNSSLPRTPTPFCYGNYDDDGLAAEEEEIDEAFVL